MDYTVSLNLGQRPTLEFSDHEILLSTCYSLICLLKFAIFFINRYYQALTSPKWRKTRPILVCLYQHFFFGAPLNLHYCLWHHLHGPITFHTLWTTRLLQLQKLHYNTQLIPVISISGSDTKIISSQSLSKTYWIKARAQKANAMHIPSITWLMLCDDPELQLSPLQQLSLVKTPHETCDVEHLGICCALLSQLDVFGSLHLL